MSTLKEGPVAIRAIFKGKSGLLGYITGKTYTLILFPTGQNRICRLDGSGICEYGSIYAFFKNWIVI